MHLTPTHQHVHASVEHVHASVKHVHPSVEHVYASTWAYAHFQLSMCTLPIYTSACSHFSWACACFSWACARSQLSMCTPQLSMCTLPVEHVHSFRWAYARLTPTHQHVHTSVEHVHTSVEHVHATVEYVHASGVHVHTPVEHVHAPRWACAHLHLSMRHFFLNFFFTFSCSHERWNSSLFPHGRNHITDALCIYIYIYTCVC